MTDDGFESTFRLRIDRATAWQRLTGQPLDDDAEAPSDRVWLPGFDSRATVVDADPPERLELVKDDEPCAGTDIVITLRDDVTGTTIRVVQSGFGSDVRVPRELMEIGWRLIVADLRIYLATGVHARRHLRAWGDLGAIASSVDGGVLVSGVRPNGLAHRLGLCDGDILTSLGSAPVTTVADLETVLRVLDATGAHPPAEWVRDGVLLHR